MEQEEHKHTISVLVENEFGVLARVASLFSGKGYNIDSLSVSPTLDPSLSRMTIVTHGSDPIIQQIVRQLEKLIPVFKVDDLTGTPYLDREMILVKVKSEGKGREGVMEMVKKYDGKVLEETAKSHILEFNGTPKELGQILDALRPAGILEFVRTGNVAMHQGEAVLDPEMQS